MNKSELINRVSEQVEGGRTAAQRAVEAVLEAIQEAVSRGERVAISGFGVFERVERAARMGRNPATGEPVEVKASAVPKFRPGTEFREYVSGARQFVTTAVNQARSTAAKQARAYADAVDPEKEPQKSSGRAPQKSPAKKAAKKTARKAPAKRASSAS